MTYPGWQLGQRRIGLQEPPSEVGWSEGAGAGVINNVTMPAPGSPMASYDAYRRARAIWGTAHIKQPTDIVAIGPLGRRNDTLLCWIAAGRVATGGDSENACFEGTIPEFVAALGSYDEEIGRLPEHDGGAYRDYLIRLRNNYLAAISFLRHICGYQDPPRAEEINRVAETLRERFP